MKLRLTEGQYKRLLSENAAPKDTVQKVVWELIARKGKSKDYTDFGKDVLNKTFIGLLHFTGDGLVRLYKKMGDEVTQQYFDKSVKKMIEEIPNYLMWGEAADFDKYKEGWVDFLKSPESEKIQDEVAYEKFSKSLISSNFTSPRQIAIGISIINSSPRKFLELGKTNEWDAEKMIRDYCKHQCETQHNFRSRCRIINLLFPYYGDNSEYVFDATSCEDMEEKSIPTPFEKGGEYDQWMDIHPDSGEISHKKIKVTEGQYKRLLSEDKRGWFNTVTPQVIKLMELIHKFHKISSKEETVKFLIRDMGLTNNGALTIWNSWVKDFSSLDIYSYKDLLGKELEFKGVYTVSADLPVYLCGRGHLPGYVTVEASSEEEAIDNIQRGEYISMEIDEDSNEWRNPDLDYDSEDADIMEDMVIDHISDYGIDEIINDIELK
tara:strand:+ start:3570 stop:4874 length:1305 start_codon:yes stop_codon:yes gene_type:complete